VPQACITYRVKNLCRAHEDVVGCLSKQTPSFVYLPFWPARESRATSKLVSVTIFTTLPGEDRGAFWLVRSADPYWIAATKIGNCRRTTIRALNTNICRIGCYTNPRCSLVMDRLLSGNASVGRTRTRDRNCAKWWFGLHSLLAWQDGPTLDKSEPDGEQ